MSQLEFVAAERDKGARLDKYLTQIFPEYSRTRLQHLIKEGYVLVDGEPSMPHHKLRLAQRILIKSLPPEIRNPSSIIQPEDRPLDIIYEDDSILVINKPIGMVTHPAPGNWSGTLVNAIIRHSPDSKNLPRWGIVHRLDKDTSGLLVVAKTQTSQLHLARQIKDRNMKRKYIALVEGVVEFDEGTVDAPIGRHPRDRKRMAVVHSDTARHAITHYRTLKKLDKRTLLEVCLDTGRTHQIRVHMAHIGHPIVGDRVYGQPPHIVDRMMLHAFCLEFSHPVTNKMMEFKTNYDMILKD